VSLKILKKNELTRDVAVVMGTRPGIIKMAPLVTELERRGIGHFIVHTGQHYSANMDFDFFGELGLPEPAFRVGTTRNYSRHGDQTAEMLRGVEQCLLERKPAVVLVCGDANTNLAAGLAARKLGIVVGHVESGLRSNDWSMPEEHNRVILDHICELLFAPTDNSKRNLSEDNVRGEVFVTGNTIVDSTLRYVQVARENPDRIGGLGLETGKFLLLTCHREENVDHRDRLLNIIEGIRLISEDLDREVIFPVHPRTVKRIDEFGVGEKLESVRGLRVIDPVPYTANLALIDGALVVLTDSGGIQEEACILHTPCVTLRDNTERPETIEVGANVIAGNSPVDMLAATREMLMREASWPVPFGDGRAAERIIDAVVPFVS